MFGLFYIQRTHIILNFEKYGCNFTKNWYNTIYKIKTNHRSNHAYIYYRGSRSKP